MSKGNMQDALHSNRKYLVTGAARGIGRAVVAQLHSLGATVYALSKNPANLKSLKEEFPNVIVVCVDLSDWDATRTAVERLEAVDCLINNAAVLVPGGFLDIQPKDFDSLMNVNLKSVINVSQIVAKKMIERGQGGTIVNVSSIAGRQVIQGVTAYGCTKAALEMLTKAMAIELGPYKIRVNSVCPAAVDTDMARQAMENESEKGNSNNGGKSLTDEMALIESRTPTRTLFMPMNDIVNTILFLGSNATSQITGESLAVDGGYCVG